MFLKTTGAILLLIASAAAGMAKAQELSRRVKILCALQDSLLVFENEIRYRLSPMREALLGAASNDLSGVFLAAAESLNKMGAAASMKKAVGTSTLKYEEKDVLLSFAAGLFAEDAEGQIKNAALCRDRINKILKSAEDRRARLYKLYCISGGMTGIAVVLLMI